MINTLDPKYTDLPGVRPISQMYRRLSSTTNHIDITVVTPFYNSGEFFTQTFVSVLAQSLQNWEWVIVDDGSTDTSSLLRLAEYAKQDGRIKVVRQENAGTAAARNTGFNNALGRYICLLDHDDMIEPTYLEKCVWFLDSNTEFSFCNSYNVIFGSQEFLWTQGFERGKGYLQANSAPPIAVIRRETFEAVGGFDATIKILYEDWDFWLKMANMGYWGFTINEYLQWYRKLEAGRYEQILKSGYDNSDFAVSMQKKYPGLSKRFPDLQRRQPEPFECMETSWNVSNLLEPNLYGRRIMFIIPWMVVGGADRVNLELIEGLIGKGHDVTVCATMDADHKWAHKYTDLTPDVFILPNILHASDYPRFLAYLIQSRQIDTVVIAGSLVGYASLPYLSAASPNTKFIDINHVEELNWLNGGHPRFGAGYQDALNLNIATTNHLAKWMQSRGADQTRVRVLYTGVKLPKFKDATDTRQLIRQRYGIATDTPLVVFAGRICEQKRPEFLAEILKAAKEANLPFQALIIGDGELRIKLESLLRQYGLKSCVQTIGSLPHEDWLKVLAGADILLLPSQNEGISIALLEAMAYGVVPVVADVGGINEIVCNNIGYLIPHGEGELDCYVRALGELVSDSESRYLKSKACHDIIAAKYQWEKTIDDFDQFITDAHQLVNSRKCHFTIEMGRELATHGFEIIRLNNTAHHIWGGTVKGNTSHTRNLNKVALRVMVYLANTNVGKYLLSLTKFRQIARSILSLFVSSK